MSGAWTDSVTFTCAGCGLSKPASEGAADDLPDHCDRCWNEAHLVAEGAWAAVGSDGIHLVVWGLGMTEDAAELEGRRWLRGVASDIEAEEAVFTYIQVGGERVKAILAGSVRLTEEEVSRV